MTVPPNACSQVILINAVRDVASALGDLINATKDAAGKSASDNSMFHLKASAKVSCVVGIEIEKR